MSTIVYHKLVRDRIPEIIRQDGKTCVCRTADREEAVELLTKKLLEEAGEYAASRETEELADVLEVVYALLAENGVSPEEIERIQLEKARKRGGFTQRIVLEEVHTP